jgi:hypothetical protein
MNVSGAFVMTLMICTGIFLNQADKSASKPNFYLQNNKVGYLFTGTRSFISIQF